MQAFDTFKVVPPGIGIVHQVNLEYLAKGVLEKDGVYYPDTLVGTDSHTTMINGLGVVGWGVGGIEAEAGMLGQPVYFLTPEVVGVHLTGALREGVTATDLALTVTQMLRKAKVVGKFVEFFGPGAARAAASSDRATIANMAPGYGATMGFFPIDEETRQLPPRHRPHRRSSASSYENYYKAQGLWGIPQKGEIEYSQDRRTRSRHRRAQRRRPKRPQDRIESAEAEAEVRQRFSRPVAEDGFGKTPSDVSSDQHGTARPPSTASQRCQRIRAARPASVTPDRRKICRPQSSPKRHQDRATARVLIAAITSCTNTCNPSVMLAAGLLAKKAVERGLNVKPVVKTRSRRARAW